MVCLAVLDSILHTLQMVWHALAEWVSAWGWIFGVLYSVTIVVTALIVILDKRDPTRTLLWVLVLVLLPVAGFVLYIFFGQNMRRLHIFRRKVPIDLSGLRSSIAPYVVSLSEEASIPSPLQPSLPIARLLLNSNRSPVLAGNSVQLFHRGREAFDSLTADLLAAERCIHLQYYIFCADTIGNTIAEILMDKAQQGVDVRIIYDAVGSWGLPRRFVRRLRASGVHIQQFQRVTFPYLANRLNYRNHRKIAIIDGHIGHIGGMNVADKYIDGDPVLGPWLDTQIRIQGPAVSALHLVLVNDWDFVTKYRHPISIGSVQYPTQEDGALIQVAASGPDSDWASIMQTFFLAISKAKRYIHICSPYFVPNESILTALRTASLSGVDVRLLLPCRGDSRLVQWATRSYIQTLLDAGIRVYMFHGGFNHSKTIVVDGEFCAVGSANMDIRSFEDNFEIVALVYDRRVAQQLDEEFRRNAAQSAELSAQGWHRRNLAEQMKDSFARLFSPLF